MDDKTRKKYAEGLRERYKSKNGRTGTDGAGWDQGTLIDSGTDDRTSEGADWTPGYAYSDPGEAEPGNSGTEDEGKRYRRNTGKLNRRNGSRNRASEPGDGSAYQGAQTGSGDSVATPERPVAILPGGPPPPVYDAPKSRGRPRKDGTPAQPRTQGTAAIKEQAEKAVDKLKLLVLSKAEVTDFSAKLRQAWIVYFSSFDEIIQATLIGHPEIHIWKSVDDESIDTIVNIQIRRAQKHAVDAAIVRSMVNLYEQVAIGTILIPRFRWTWEAYMQYGVDIPGVRKSRKREAMKIVRE